MIPYQFSQISHWPHLSSSSFQLCLNLRLLDLPSSHCYGLVLAIYAQLTGRPVEGIPNGHCYRGPASPGRFVDRGVNLLYPPVQITKDLPFNGQSRLDICRPIRRFRLDDQLTFKMSPRQKSEHSNSV
jgi:hypothetical protein